MPVPRSMQWPSLASKAFDTMQRCACWWQTKFDIARPKITIRYGQARAVWRFPLLRVERTWLGRGPRSEFDRTRTLTQDQPIMSTQLRGWQQRECKTMLTQIYEVATPAEAEA